MQSSRFQDVKQKNVWKQSAHPEARSVGIIRDNTYELEDSSAAREERGASTRCNKTGTREFSKELLHMT